jgi:hypothetical protein
MNRPARTGWLTLLCYCVCLSSVASPQTVELAQLSPAIYEDLAGNYQVARDRVISVGPFSEAENFPVFFDSKTRRVGLLYPVSETEYVTGALDAHHMLTPADVHVTFGRNQSGYVTSLMWHESKADASSA